MRPLVFSAPAYNIAFAVALLLWVIPERIGAFWLRSGRDPSAHRQDRGSMYVLIGTLVVGLFAGFVLALKWQDAAIPWLRPEVTIAGIALILIGVALRWWAIFTLGRYFTLDVAVRSTQTVVQSGPYRFVRHPSYTGILLILLGIALALANWVSLVVILVGGVCGLLYRVRVEERALTEALGQPYVDYMRHAKRFIPFIM
jgi:protein-S-isoprenylcysteine O-methyltransferase Ste14